MTSARGGGVSSNDDNKDHLADLALLAFMHRITVSSGHERNARGLQARHACRMSVTTAGGDRLQHDVYDRFGSAENPVDRAALAVKSGEKARHCLWHAQAQPSMADHP